MERASAGSAASTTTTRAAARRVYVRCTMRASNSRLQHVSLSLAQGVQLPPVQGGDYGQAATARRMTWPTTTDDDPCHVPNLCAWHVPPHAQLGAGRLVRGGAHISTTVCEFWCAPATTWDVKAAVQASPNEIGWHKRAGAINTNCR